MSCPGKGGKALGGQEMLLWFRWDMQRGLLSGVMAGILSKPYQVVCNASLLRHGNTRFIVRFFSGVSIMSASLPLSIHHAVCCIVRGFSLKTIGHSRFIGVLKHSCRFRNQLRSIRAQKCSSDAIDVLNTSLTTTRPANMA